MYVRWGNLVCVTPLTLLICVTAVCGPVLEALWQERARCIAHDLAAQHPGERPAEDDADSDLLLVPQGCEWDRVAKASVSVRIVRCPASTEVQRTEPHHRPRFELASAAPSPSALLAIDGPNRNHEPHGPPCAG